MTDTPARADETAAQVAARALKLCLAGDGAAGLALYRNHLTTDDAAHVSLGFHARMIEQAGDAATAEALRRLGVRRGFDISWQTSLTTHRPPAQAARIYADLIERGYANPTMVDRYLLALTALGRTDEVAAVFDAPRLLYRTTLGDAAAVAATLMADEAAIPYNERVQISYAMRSIDDLHALRHPVFDALLAEVGDEMTAYLDRFAASDHPLARLVPRDFAIEAWGMVSRGAGHHVRHQHPRGWVTGVYYPAALPAGSVGGTLRVGGWSDPASPGWPDATIVPEAGLLVLLPSWYVHWTEPTRSEGARLSIAIDAVRHRLAQKAGRSGGESGGS